MDLSIILNSLPLFLGGLLTTLQLTLLSLLIGLVLAIPLALARVSQHLFLSLPVRFFVYIFRGTPLLVQMLIIYYGLGQFEFIRSTIFWPFLKEAYFCALLSFSLNTGAYTTEILRGAIKSTPVAEIDSGKSLGMSRFLLLRRILLPSALRRAIPAYGNEVIFMLHGSALASVITLIDLTGAARIVNSRYYSPYEAFITAGIFYLLITLLIVWIFKQLEKRIYAHLQKA